MVRMLIRKARLDTLARARFNDGSFYFFKFFFSKRTGLRMIKQGSYTVLSGAFDRYKDGYLIGRYGQNLEKSDVPIFYVTKSGVRVWKLLSGIRHVHKISVQGARVIVSTGDIEGECRILIYTEQGDLIDELCSGQLTRAGDVHVYENTLKWVMDSEYEDSWTVEYDMVSQVLKKCHNIRQPVWHSVLVGDEIVFSTSLECKSIWKGNRAVVYKWSLDTDEVIPLVTFKYRWWIPLRYFPAQSVSIINNPDHLVLLPRGISGSRILLKKSHILEPNLMNLDIALLENGVFPKNISKKDLVLSVLKIGLHDNRFYNFYLKRLQ